LFVVCLFVGCVFERYRAEGMEDLNEEETEILAHYQSITGEVDIARSVGRLRDHHWSLEVIFLLLCCSSSLLMECVLVVLELFEMSV
jgi:hypothetical protein